MRSLCVVIIIAAVRPGHYNGETMEVHKLPVPCTQHANEPPPFDLYGLKNKGFVLLPTIAYHSTLQLS